MVWTRPGPRLDHRTVCPKDEKAFAHFLAILLFCHGSDSRWQQRPPFMQRLFTFRAHRAGNISRRWYPNLVKGRFSSTSASDRFSRFTARTGFLLAGSSLIGVSLGFSLANQFPPSQNDTTKPQYGSPVDFAKAIQELKASFPGEDAVSTDPEDIYNHGFSLNDCYPGVLARFCSTQLSWLLPVRNAT